MTHLTTKERRMKEFDDKFTSDIEGLGRVMGNIPICPEHFIFSEPIKAFLSASIDEAREELIRKTEERLVGLCGTIHCEPYSKCEQCEGMQKLLQVLKSK